MSFTLGIFLIIIICKFICNVHAQINKCLHMLYMRYDLDVCPTLHDIASIQTSDIPKPSHLINCVIELNASVCCI